MALKTRLETSGLTQEDKDLWFSIIEKLDEAQIKILEDFIENKEENLRFLTENIKAKANAFKNFDEKAFEEIITGEK